MVYYISCSKAIKNRNCLYCVVYDYCATYTPKHWFDEDGNLLNSKKAKVKQGL